MRGTFALSRLPVLYSPSLAVFDNLRWPAACHYSRPALERLRVPLPLDIAAFNRDQYLQDVIAVFAASAIVLWLNGALAHRLAKRQGHLPPPIAPWGSNDQTLTAALQRLSPGLPWRFLITGSAVVLATLIALGKVGSWDVAIRFIWQVPYGQSDPPLRQKYRVLSLFASRLRRNQKLDAADARSERSFRRCGLFCAEQPHLSARVRLLSPWVIRLTARRCSVFSSRSRPGPTGWTAISSSTATMVWSWGHPIRTSISSSPCLWVLVGLASVAAIASWANVWMRSYRLPAVGAGFGLRRPRSCSVSSSRPCFSAST